MVIVRFAGTTWPRYFQVSGAPEHQRLEARVRDARRPCRARACRLQQLDHRLDAERAGLHRVLEEVRLEEPLAGVDVLLGAQRSRGPCVPPSGQKPVTRSSISSIGPAQPRRAVAVARGPRREVDRGRAHGAVEARALVVGGGQPDLVLERRLREEAEHGVHRRRRARSPRKHSTSKASMIIPADCEIDVICAARAQRAAAGTHLGEQRAGAVEVAEQQVRLAS